MNRKELLKEIRSLQGRCFYVEAKLPYETSKHDTKKEFMAEMRRRLYVVRCSLGSIEKTLLDERNVDAADLD
jgi:hypothetical protein